MKAFLCALAAALAVVPAANAQGDIARGRSLFLDGCSSCHGFDARGISGVAPDLHGVGARAADFYLSTGRMPFHEQTGEEPFRAQPAYSKTNIDALVGYIGSLGGPPIPTVDPARGSLAEGLHAFTVYCAGCHQVVGEGGVVTGATPPPLDSATPTEIAEAVRVGPYVMPAFDEATIDDRTLNSIVRYIEYTKHPDDRGGWSLGHIGPIPEGMATWFLALAVLLVVARLLGERSPR